MKLYVHDLKRNVSNNRINKNSYILFNMSFIEIVLLLSFLTREICCTDFCSIKCDNGKIHTLCNGCDVQEPCRSYIQQKPLTIEEQQYILDIHNELRNKVATGKQIGQPKSTNMKVLLWDSELANVASCWANSCKFKHDCADFPDKYAVGQNLAMKGLDGPEREKYIKGKQVLRDMIEAWFNEVNKYNYKYTDSYETTKAAHYTQLVWADTYLVGCERIFFEKDEKLKIHLVCNYAPAGNFIGDPLYNAGEPCSECKCDYTYSGLCGKSKILSAKGVQIHICNGLLALITLALFLIY